MTAFAEIRYDMTLRANSARRRNEHLVLELEEAIALWEAIMGPDVPYQTPDLFLGVPVRVLDPERPRSVLRSVP
jgi:hypothetical protein